MEDGFLHSLRLGSEDAEPLSPVVDHVGIYYDATGPSELENLLADGWEEPALMASAEKALTTIIMLSIYQIFSYRIVDALFKE